MRMDFLSSHLNTKETPPWAPWEDLTRQQASSCCPGPASLWGSAHGIISKLLLSSPPPLAEAQPSAHVDTQSLVFLPPQKRKGVWKGSSAPAAHPWRVHLSSRLHPQGTLGTPVCGRKHTAAPLLWPLPNVTLQRDLTLKMNLHPRYSS